MTEMNDEKEDILKNYSEENSVLYVYPHAIMKPKQIEVMLNLSKGSVSYLIPKFFITEDDMKIAKNTIVDSIDSIIRNVPHSVKEIRFVLAGYSPLVALVYQLYIIISQQASASEFYKKLKYTAVYFVHENNEWREAFMPDYSDNVK